MKIQTKILAILMVILLHSLLAWSWIAVLIGPHLPLLGEKIVRLSIVICFSGLLAFLFGRYYLEMKKWYKFVLIILGFHGLGFIAFAQTNLFPEHAQLKSDVSLYLSVFFAFLILLGAWEKEQRQAFVKLALVTIVFAISYGAVYGHGFIGAFGGMPINRDNPTAKPCPENDCFVDFQPQQGDFAFGWLDLSQTIGVKLSALAGGDYSLSVRVVTNVGGTDRILLNENRVLTPSQGKAFLDGVKQSGFWEFTQEAMKSEGLGGYTLSFLAEDQGKPHFLRCWVPTYSWRSQQEKAAKLRMLKLAVSILNASNLKLPKRAFFEGL